MLGVYRPRHVLGGYLTIVGRIGDAGVRPVLGVDEVSTLEGFLLVVLHAGIPHELRVELVSFWVSDDEIHVSGIHPLGKRVGHSLRQCTAVGSPGQHDLWPFYLFILLDGNEIGKGLQGMHGGRLHSEDGLAAVLDELLKHGLGIVVLAVSESCKGAYADHIAVASHDGNGFEQML